MRALLLLMQDRDMKAYGPLTARRRRIARDPARGVCGRIVGCLSEGPQSLIRGKPSQVPAGDLLLVDGYARGCQVVEGITLISRAFSRREAFAGGPAITADIRNADGYFHERTKIPGQRRPGKYSITARCGGGHIGVQAVSRVLGRRASSR